MSPLMNEFLRFFFSGARKRADLRGSILYLNDHNNYDESDDGDPS